MRRDLTLFGELNRVDRRGVSALFTRPAIQRRFKLPDRRVAWSLDRIKGNAGAGFTTIALDLEPAITAVQALSGCRRWLRRATEALHLFRPKRAFGGIRLTNGFPRPFTRMLGMDFRAADPITKNAPSRWTAHGTITSALAAAGNPTRI